MSEYNIYKDISERTGGEIYIGVVGPVRTGKSTFIKRFMDCLVIPSIDNEYSKERAKDELPMSGSGKTICTTEPKFIPDDAVEITVGANAKMKVRMIDCVGYLVDGAVGHEEEEAPRMVTTPWQTEPMEFALAAEIGTKKVICDHSTIGLVITTDGSVTDLEREAYQTAEKKVISELKQLNKPFAVVLNTKYKNEPQTQKLRQFLESEYKVPVVACDCQNVTEEEIKGILEKILRQFPILQIAVNLPGWLFALDDGHKLKTQLYEAVLSSADGLKNVCDTDEFLKKMGECELVSGVITEETDMGKGTCTVCAKLPKEIFWETAREMSGFEIKDDASLLTLLSDMAKIKAEYEKISQALSEVKENGYGIVMPQVEDLSLCEPEIVRQGGRYGVRLRASAPSIHMIKADIETEVSPVVGSEKQSEDLVKYLLSEFETDPKSIWESNIFGKSLHELVSEGLKGKLMHMPDDARAKLRETLSRIINEGSGGLICIIL